MSSPFALRCAELERWHATKYTASAFVTHLSFWHDNAWTDAADCEALCYFNELCYTIRTPNRKKRLEYFIRHRDHFDSRQANHCFTCCEHTKTPDKDLGMLKWESVLQLMLSFGTETGWIKITLKTWFRHPRHNAVSSISGCPSCDHVVLSFQSHVILSPIPCQLEEQLQCISFVSH